MILLLLSVEPTMSGPVVVVGARYFDTQTSPCPYAVCVQCGAVGVATSVFMCVDELAVSVDVGCC